MPDPETARASHDETPPQEAFKSAKSRPTVTQDIRMPAERAELPMAVK